MAAVSVSLAAIGASVYPVLGPILEIRSLSLLDAEGVEAAVRPSEPLQNADGAGLVKLTGEDALLDWPNALGPGRSRRLSGYTAKFALLMISSVIAPRLISPTVFEVYFYSHCNHMFAHLLMEGFAEP